MPRGKKAGDVVKWTQPIPKTSEDEKNEKETPITSGTKCVDFSGKTGR